MIKKLEITEDHLKLIPFFYMEQTNDNEITFDKRHMYDLGSHLLEDMAFILGKNDCAIKGSDDDPNGRAYTEEATNYMLQLHKYITDNLYYIETLIHQFVVKGGITAGTYKAKDNELIWEKIDEKK